MKKLIIAVALMFSLSACNPIIIGDSISNMSRGNFDAHLSNHYVNAADGRGAYNAGVNGQPGTGIEAVRLEAKNVPAGGWMVVELGGNNLSFDANYRAWFIFEVTNALPNDRCLAWVTPYAAFQPTQTAAWAASIAAYVPVQPCHAIVRWDLTAAAHPEYMADLVHPNAAGKEALVCLIVKAIGMGTGC